MPVNGLFLRHKGVQNVTIWGWCSIMIFYGQKGGIKKQSTVHYPVYIMLYSSKGMNALFSLTLRNKRLAIDFWVFFE